MGYFEIVPDDDGRMVGLVSSHWLVWEYFNCRILPKSVKCSLTLECIEERLRCRDLLKVLIFDLSELFFHFFSLLIFTNLE